MFINKYPPKNIYDKEYWRVDDVQRERLRRDWNHPVLWPLWLIGLMLVGLGLWAFQALRKRELAK